MSDIEGLYFVESLGLLVCKVHGTGIHPDVEAIRRHLRGKDHFCEGKTLKEAVNTLGKLSLSSRAELLDKHPVVATQPIPAIPHLTVHDGWCCSFFQGSELTTSGSISDRHARTGHKLKPSGHSVESPYWRACKLQTLFSMTGDVRCFQVSTPTPGRRIDSSPTQRRPMTLPGLTTTTNLDSRPGDSWIVSKRSRTNTKRSLQSQPTKIQIRMKKPLERSFG